MADPVPPAPDDAPPPAAPVPLLDALTAVRADPGEPGQWWWSLPPGWEQGRGAWGGAVVGAVVAAARAAVPEALAAGQRVRSVSAQLVGAVPAGDRRLRVEVLRRGSATTTVAVRVEGPVAGEGGRPVGADTVLAHGVVVLGRDRGVPLGRPGWPVPRPPAALTAGWRHVAPIPDVGPPLAPVFLQHLEIRPVTGLPFAGDDEVVGWVRPRPAAPVGNDVYLAAMVDAWWTVLLTALTQPRPVATLSFALELAADPATLPRDDDGTVAPLMHRGRGRSLDEGHLVETRELWTLDGRLAAWNSQTVVLVR